MYESFYKLHTTPFRLTPDPRFFFESETHKRGLAYLRYAFYQREGFVVITGAPGTGKTELMLNLVGELPQRKVTIAKIVTSNLDADDLLDLVASSFSIDPEHLSKGSLLKRLEDYFVREYRMGKQVLLLIDEAHNLSVKSLIELSMLSNFQIDARPVMQCFLLGQRPLEGKFRLPELSPLKQRVIASTRLKNLDPQETCDYVMHRLSKSGWDNDPTIDDGVFSLIHYYSQGTPRRINSLCSRLLLQAYLDDRHHITADNVRQVISEIQEEAVGKYPDGAEVESLANKPSRDQSPARPANSSPLLITTRNDIDHHVSVKDVTDAPAITATARQGKQYTGSAITIVDQESSNAVRHLPQWLDTDAVDDDLPTVTLNKPQEDDVVDPDAIDFLIRETPTWDVGLPPASVRDVNHQDRGRATHPVRDVAKNAAVQSRDRTSGLLDKELKYLSSLQDTSSNGTGAPPSAAQQEPAAKSSGGKVIIDDSIYDVYGVRKPEPEDEDIRHDNFTGSEKHFWLKMFVAVVALAIIAIPIRAWYHQHSDVADRTTAQQSQRPVEASRATDNIANGNTTNNNSNKPSVPTTQAEAKRPLPTTKPERAQATGPTVIPGTVKPPVQASVIKQPGEDTNGDSSPTAASADQPIASHFAAFENNAVPDLPERQSAQPVSNPDKNAQSQGAADSQKVKKNSAIRSGDHNTGTQPTSTAQENKPTKAQVTPVIVPVRPYSLAKHRVIETGPVEDATQSKDTAPTADNVNTGVDSSANARATVAPQTQRDSPDATSAVAKIDNGEPSSLSSNDRDVNPYLLKPAISLSDLTTVVATLSSAYESGNLPQLLSVFADDMQNGDGENRDQLQDEYQQLFDITDKRRLIINNVAWSARNQQMLGKGDFQLIIREKGATKLTLYAGQIRLAVAREPRGVVIKKLDYDYNQ